MITVSNFTKRYGSFTAVDNLSFHVAKGEIVGFLGVNGAGKTTTLRTLAGILEPTSGELAIGGHSLRTDPREAKRITGFVPDRPHLYSRLTAREYLAFVADLYEVPVKQQRTKIAELLHEYRLEEWGNELVESFSHGMKQRLATCGALVHNPQVIIVDEPMVGLDPHGAKLLKSALTRYASEGAAILLSTHSLNVAEEVAHRIMILNKGALIATGSVSEITALAAGGNLEKVFLELTQNAESL